MGRAIEQDNRLDSHDSKLNSHDSKFNDFDRRLKLIEDALEELVQTKVHHVDLHDMDKEYIDKLKEEEFTPPSGKRKKTTKVEQRSTEKSSAEA